MPSKIADYKLRFFAPGGEVNLCGHATIAAFYALAIKKRIRGKDRITLRQETKAGVLPVDMCFKNGKVERIMMQQTQPQFLETIGREEIFPLLNLGKEHIRDIPCEVVSTGLKLLVVPLDSLSTLKKLEPDFDKIKKFSEANDIVGIHCFSTETFDLARQLMADSLPL